MRMLLCLIINTLWVSAGDSSIVWDEPWASSPEADWPVLAERLLVPATVAMPAGRKPLRDVLPLLRSGGEVTVDQPGLLDRVAECPQLNGTFWEAMAVVCDRYSLRPIPALAGRIAPDLPENNLPHGTGQLRLTNRGAVTVRLIPNGVFALEVFDESFTGSQYWNWKGVTCIRSEPRAGTSLTFEMTTKTIEDTRPSKIWNHPLQLRNGEMRTWSSATMGKLLAHLEGAIRVTASGRMLASLAIQDELVPIRPWLSLQRRERSIVVSATRPMLVDDANAFLDCCWQTNPSAEANTWGQYMGPIHGHPIK